MTQEIGRAGILFGAQTAGFRAEVAGAVASAKAGMAEIGNSAQGMGQKVTGAANQASSGLKKGAADAESSAGRFSGAMKAISLASKVVAVAAVAAIADGLLQAEKFQTTWAKLTQVIKGTPAQMAALQQGFFDLGKTIPTSIDGLVTLGEQAASLHIARDNILSFVKVASQMGVTTNMSASEAETALAKLSAILNIQPKQWTNLGSTITKMGKDTVASGSDIVAVATKVGAIGRQINLTTPDIIGWSAAIGSQGLMAKQAATGLGTLFDSTLKAIAATQTSTKVTATSTAGTKALAAAQTALEKAQARVNSATTYTTRANAVTALTKAQQKLATAEGAAGTASAAANAKAAAATTKANLALSTFASVSHMTMAQFSKDIQSPGGANAALQSFLEGYNKLSAVKQIEVQKSIGLVGTANTKILLALSQHVKDLKKDISDANGAWTQNSALGEDAAIAFGTVSSKIQLLKNVFEAFEIKLGLVFLPVLGHVLDILTFGLPAAINFLAGIANGVWKTVTDNLGRPVSMLVGAFQRLLGQVELLFGGGPAKGATDFGAAIGDGFGIAMSVIGNVVILINQVVTAVTDLVTIARTDPGAALRKLFGDLTAAAGAFVGSLLGFGQAGGVGVGLWSQIIKFLSPVIDQLKSWILQAAPIIATALQGWAKTFYTWITNPPLWPKVVAFLTTFVLQMRTWIGSNVQPLLNQLGKWAGAFIGWIAPMIPPALRELARLGGEILGWISDQVGPILTQLGAWANTIVNWIGQQVGPIGNALLGWATAFVAWLIPIAGTAAGSLIGGIQSLLGNAIIWMTTTGVPMLIAAGGELAKALIKGIISNPGAFAEALLAFFTAAAVIDAVSTAGDAIGVALATSAASKMIASNGLVAALRELGSPLSAAARLLGLSVGDALAAGILVGAVAALVITFNSIRDQIASQGKALADQASSWVQTATANQMESAIAGSQSDINNTMARTALQMPGAQAAFDASQQPLYEKLKTQFGITPVETNGIITGWKDLSGKLVSTVKDFVVTPVTDALKTGSTVIPAAIKKNLVDPLAVATAKARAAMAGAGASLGGSAPTLGKGLLPNLADLISPPAGYGGAAPDPFAGAKASITAGGAGIVSAIIATTRPIGNAMDGLDAALQPKLGPSATLGGNPVTGLQGPRGQTPESSVASAMIAQFGNKTVLQQDVANWANTIPVGIQKATTAAVNLAKRTAGDITNAFKSGADAVTSAEAATTAELAKPQTAAAQIAALGVQKAKANAKLALGMKDNDPIAVAAAQSWITALEQQIDLIKGAAVKWGLEVGKGFQQGLSQVKPTIAALTQARSSGIPAAMPAFQSGSWDVPSTGPAILHEGEIVVPPAAATGIRKMMLQRGTLSGISASNPFDRLVQAFTSPSALIDSLSTMFFGPGGMSHVSGTTDASGRTPASQAAWAAQHAGGLSPQSMKAYQSGAWSVPSTAPATIHAGEIVVPPVQAGQMRGLLTKGLLTGAQSSNPIDRLTALFTNPQAFLGTIGAMFFGSGGINHIAGTTDPSGRTPASQASWDLQHAGGSARTSMRAFAGGGVFDTTGRTPITVGEAGGESVAILRNFKHSILSDLIGLPRPSGPDLRMQSAMPAMLAAAASSAASKGSGDQYIHVDDMHLYDAQDEAAVTRNLAFLMPNGN